VKSISYWHFARLIPCLSDMSRAVTFHWDASTTFYIFYFCSSFNVLLKRKEKLTWKKEWRKFWKIINTKRFCWTLCAKNLSTTSRNYLSKTRMTEEVSFQTLVHFVKCSDTRFLLLCDKKMESKRRRCYRFSELQDSHAVLEVPKKYWISKLTFMTLKKYWILPKSSLGIEKVWKI